MNPKTFCVVPFCRRWTRRLTKGYRWICSDHWPLVDRSLKRLRNRITRRRKILEETPEYQAGLVHRRILNAIKSDRTIWRRMEAQAIDRALTGRGKGRRRR